MTPNVDELFDTVVRKIADDTGRAPKGTPPSVSMCCPAHEDRNPSLTVSIGKDRDRVVLHCHTGCTAEQVAGAVGLELRDLFVPDDQPHTPTPAATTVSPPAVYEYHDADGTLLGKVHRKAGKRFVQQRADGTWKGFGRHLYRLPHVLAAVREGRGVVVVEGEKDADRLAADGIAATCNIGGAGKWTDDLAAHLAGASVVVVADNDQPGRDHAHTVATSLHGVAASVKVLELPGLPEHGDVSDWLDQGRTVDDLRALAADTAPFDPAGQPDEPDRFPPVDWHQLWAGVDDEVDWIVDGIVEAGRHAALYAPHKGGKSLLMLEVAAAVAAGDTTVLGRPIPRARTVLYVDWENSPADLLGRLKALGRDPAELSRLVYLSLPMLAPLDTDRGGDELAALARQHDADLVILDTFSRAVEGAENDADTYRDYYRACGIKLKAAGVSLWRLDHSGKDATRGQRGSSAKGDDVDAVWKLTPSTGGRLTLKRELTRTLHGLEELRLVRPDGQTRLRPDVTSVGPPAEPTLDDLEPIIDHLDRLDVPLDWGRRRAGRALRDEGVSVSNDMLGAALTVRKHRTPEDVADANKRTGAPDRDDTPADRSAGRSTGGPETGPGPVPDRSRTGLDRRHGDPSDRVDRTHPRPARDGVRTGPEHPPPDHPTSSYRPCPGCGHRTFGDGPCHACQVGGAA